MPESPGTVQAVIDRLRAIDAELSPGDGAAVFNRMYLTVTERVAAGLDGVATFANNAFMADLDVAFANLWLSAYDAASAGGDVPSAWAPLFEVRRDLRLLPIQFALAGMNAHIEHDLPVAVVDTCLAHSTYPDAPGIHSDYEAVNAVLAAEEGLVRRSFLSEFGQVVDAHIGSVVHLISAWNIDKARDLAWVTVEALWALRPLRPLYDRYEDAVSRSVGMTSRCLLTPSPVVEQT